jgi:polysaccharide biosynthesis protein PslH
MYQFVPISTFTGNWPVVDPNDNPVPRRRVLWLSHLLPWPPKGGLMQRSYYLMREVARHHELQVIAFRQRAHQPDEASLAEAKSALSSFSELVHISDLPEGQRAGGRNLLALRSLLPGAPYTIRWGMDGKYPLAVQRAIHDFRPHVVHFDTISLAPYLDHIGKIPAVLNHHNIESQMLLRRSEQERNLVKRFYYWQEGTRLAAYEKRVARRFKSHLVCAELDGARLIDTVGAVAFQVVPNGVDLEYFQPAAAGTPLHPGSMIFVGGLTWYPNVTAIRFFLTKVWPILVTRRSDVEFRLIGRNPPTDILELAARDSRIKPMGFVDDIRPIVHQSMVYVCPIFDGGGTKLKMLDAMAMGKAIVAHPVACEGLDITDGLQALQASAPEAFATAILRLMDDRALRMNLEIEGRKHVCEHFSFASIGRELSRSYSAMTETSRKTTGGQ